MFFSCGFSAEFQTIRHHFSYLFLFPPTTNVRSKRRREKEQRHSQKYVAMEKEEK